MGASSTILAKQPHSPEEVIEEYLQSDPGFDIIYFQKLLHPQLIDAIDVINIRRAFLNIRDDRYDPEEFIRLKRLRRYNLLSNDDIIMLELREHPIL